MFNRRAQIMKNIPYFLRGAFRNCLRLAMEEACQADHIRRERGWKLFMLLPRMLLHRPPRGGNIPRHKLQERFNAFGLGQWASLIRQAIESTEIVAIAQRRGQRQRGDDVGKRAERAQSFVLMGEISSGRQALEGEAVAPGTEATLNLLEDAERRPPVPIIEVPQGLMEHMPAAEFGLDQDKFARNLRSSRKGAAPGPSGMTSEHLRPLLSKPDDVHLLFRMGEQLARAQVPNVVIDAIRMGRMTALSKPDGGVRGIVAGDIMRRLVGRTIAQQINPTVERFTALFQCAMTTRAGTECVAHALQALTETDPEATVMSLDGISAFDLISRKSMLEAFCRMPGGEQVLPFVRMFYGAPSVHLWEDDLGVVHHIHQGEGGDQGDPLMPLLYALGQHGALVSIQGMMREGERLFAFLDDLYVVTVPDRIGAMFAVVQEYMRRDANIRVHLGKIKVWNAGGIRPRACEVLQQIVDAAGSRALVWRGSDLPTAEQGIKVLGTPLGLAAHLRNVLESHRTLLERIPLVQDVQCAWRSPCELSVAGGST